MKKMLQKIIKYCKIKLVLTLRGDKYEKMCIYC